MNSVISADSRWRFNDQEAAMMRSAGYDFEGPETDARFSELQALLAAQDIAMPSNIDLVANEKFRTEILASAGITEKK